MKEEGKKSTNLLIPLGIGAGLLLLLSMKKKDEKAPATNTADTPAIPQIKSEEAAVPQITPDPAPQYTLPDTQAKSAGEEEDNSEDSDTEQSETAPSDQEESSDENDPSSSSEEDAPDESDAPSGSGSGNRSSGGGYTPSSSINANARTTAPVNSSTKWDSATKAKQDAEFQRRGPSSPYIGNGKPRMGVQQPVAYRPGASNVNPATNTTSAAQHSIMIARNPHAARPTVKKQATIFPLQMGHRNAYVKEVQRRIGVSPTGFFGAQTRAALQQRYGVTAISEALYKQIITGKVAVTAVAAAKRPHAAPVRKNRKPIHKKGKPHVIRK